MTQRKFGALPAPPAPDVPAFPRVPRGDALPARVHLEIPTPVQDQGNLGSCTGQAYAKAIEILVGTGVEISALGSYFFNRVQSGLPSNQDTGAFMHSSLEACKRYGMGSEALWPYDVNQYDQMPSEAYQRQALDHRVEEGYRATGVTQAKSALAGGFPAVIGFDVPPGFIQDVGQDGLWRDPGGSALGGHAVVMVGYDDQKVGGPGCWPGCFLVLNSWGEDWGQNGLFLLPYSAFQVGGRVWESYVMTLVDDEAGD
jgi:C1A family cysteine protease